ncbi:lipase family protein [Nocardia arthritidis]|uniref:Lipase n=1 Tax=Nocardia arthritidis TaxID=228602 RepID=A0A6G9YSI9_9NOCA|nr:lipase family protein [Nocardia arthritidis]QIS16182.1 lipase [Nocardia arthritidis]
MRSVRCLRGARMFGSFTAALAIAAALLAPGAHADPVGELLNPARIPADILPTPLDDPFYSPPLGFEKLAPGTVLASRPGGTPSGTVPVTSTELLLRSTDAKDNPVPVVATLLVPVAPWPGSGPRPLVSYNAAIDSLGNKCAPSYKLRQGSSDKMFETNISLAKGYAVVIPDHEGPRQAYAAGRMAGHAVLDAIRAAIGTPELGLRPDAPVVVTGYSGGAIASGWAAQLAPEYAPDVHLVGAAFGGVPADFGLLLATMNGKNAASGVFLAATLGLAREYPEMLELMNDNGWRLARLGRDMCVNAEGVLGAVAPLTVQTFTDQKAPTELPMVRRILAENRLGASAPTVPVFLYHGANEFWIPLASATNLYHDWCGQGAQVRLEVYLGEHSVVGLSGIPGATGWIEDRFAGKPAPTGCSSFGL